MIRASVLIQASLCKTGILLGSGNEITHAFPSKVDGDGVISQVHTAAMLKQFQVMHPHLQIVGYFSPECLTDMPDVRLVIDDQGTAMLYEGAMATPCQISPTSAEKCAIKSVLDSPRTDADALDSQIRFLSVLRSRLEKLLATCNKGDKLREIESLLSQLPEECDGGVLQDAILARALHRMAETSLQ